MERITLGDIRKLAHNRVIRKCDQGLVSEDWALRKPMCSQAERRGPWERGRFPGTSPTHGAIQEAKSFRGAV